jgi:hypothetical protein
MMKLPLANDLYPQQTVQIEQVSALSDAEQPSEVLLLGDSFSNIYSLSALGWGEKAGFAEHLSYWLKQPVEKIAINDNGSFATRQELLRATNAGVDPLAGKKVVIWEFVSRELVQGDWKLIDLSAVKESTSVALSGMISGKIKAITKAPQPGSVPYRDALIAIHLQNVKANNQELAEEIVVFATGMKDNVLTGSAKLKPGDDIEISVQPWQEVVDQLGAYNRVELDSDETLLLDTYWSAEFGIIATPDNEPEETQQSPEKETIEPTETTPEPDLTVAEDIDVAFILNRMRQITADLMPQKQNSYAGTDGWFFYVPELRSLSAGQFWGEKAAAISQANNPDIADPLPAILDFQRQLDQAGIKLIMVPVPPKAAVYPEKIAPEFAGFNERIDGSLSEFYQLLRDQGVDVIDLQPLLAKLKIDGDAYCRQDTHWSPAAIERTAKLLAEKITAAVPLADLARKEFVAKEEILTFTGDLLLNKEGYESVAKESKLIEKIYVREGGQEMPFESWRESPVLLLGDSHCLVFSAGNDMFAESAGLPEHLSKELGFAVDSLAVRGSGATPTRISLARRRDNLAGKKIVIWCFTAREFTEAASGWRNIPVIR